MKRYIYIMFACVCAMFSTTNAWAQEFATGDIITITDGTNYLAVNDAGTSITDKTTVDESCYWEVIVDTDGTYLYSVTAKKYLYIRKNRLEISGDKYACTYNGNKLYRTGNGGTYYVRYDSGWTASTDANNATTLTLAKVSTLPEFTLVSPTAGTTSAFTSVTLTTETTIGTLQFGPYNTENNQKVHFTFTSADGSTTAESYVLQGLSVTKSDDNTLVITIPENLGEGEYSLSIEEGAILTADGEAFAAATYTWTVAAHTFATISPDAVATGDYLDEIVVTATNNVAMTIADADKIVLTNANNVVIQTTLTVNADNELVIAPVAALGNGTYTLTIEDGAVKGPQNVSFTGTTKSWTVIATVSITHVPGFYSALGAGGYQQTHTVERTIYYTGSETSVPLELAESNFFGYMRWYNYNTDNGNGITWATAPTGYSGAFTEIEGTTTHLGWFGWRNSVEGGVLYAAASVGENSNNTPSINISDWTGNYTIACDVSNYSDFEITRINDAIVGVTEPRLSYRQLFHFRPASEMADQFTNLAADKYLEEYTYTAPTNTDVYLATNYRFNGTIAENCYFYYNGSNVERVTSATWSGDGTVTQSGAFGVVSSQTTGTKTYYLKSGDLRIAKFTVTYVTEGQYGPVQETTNNGTTKALMSYAEMKANYEVLEYNNFSYGNTPTSSTKQFLTTPLPWNESTYGFYDGTDDVVTSPGYAGVPYYGQYALVNYIESNGIWLAVTANHVDGETNDTTAAAQGYAMYVDGTTKPGVVASISTNVTICGERTMYCSIWLRNPRGTDCGNSGVYIPIFRCNVQGRNKLSDGSYTDWEDVDVYFVGELGCTSGWTQILFPIESQETYTECRVQIYNFGTGGNGNDFLVDDLCIFAEKVPMASYQLQTEMCCSPDLNGTTYTAVALRVDYGSTTLTKDSYQYYQIYNKTTKTPLTLESDSPSPYYHEDTNASTEAGLTTEQYGSILVQSSTFEPDASDIKAPSVLVGELLDAYHEDNTKPLWGKCYVEKDASEITSTSPGKYYMYIVHIIPNIKGNRVEENYLHEHCEYTLRMTNSVGDLVGETLSCAVEIAVPSTQQSLFRLMNDQINDTEFLTRSANNCPNDLYTIEAFIRKDTDPYSDAGKLEGTYLADWMYAFAFDEVYRMDYPHASDEAENSAKDAADTQFAAAYGRTRQQVIDAFLDLRRVPSGEDTNPNNAATTFGAINPEYFTDYKDGASEYYETLKYMYENDWLQLRTSSVSFYLGEDATARYWVFPIENSAMAADGVTPLHDCPEPRWVQVSTKESGYYLNVAPGLDLNNITNVDPRQNAAIPNVRVLARLVNSTIQIPVRQMSTGDYEIQCVGDDAYLYLTNDNAITNPQALKYTCSLTDGIITLIPAAGNTASLQIGNEYTMCIRLRNKNSEYKSATDANCNVGKVYVRLVILPDVITWNPKTDSQEDAWHDDANWDGTDSYSQYHYAPIAGSQVIIPATAASPELSTMDVANHPYPLDANFALTPTCGQIYFESGAMMLNQHMLVHDKALVDMRIPNQTWNTIAIPMSGVVSGDMFIPHSGDETNGSITESTDPFTIKSFEGARHSETAYPFWLSVYNKTVEKVNENPSKTGTTISTNTKVFASTNSLVEPMNVGVGYQLLGFGPSNHSGDLTIRLPKTDATYAYYYATGALGSNVSVARSSDAGKLKYDPATPITLTNEQTSQSFMFGNPTMAMIDLAQFIPDGAVVYQMIDDTWYSETKAVLATADSKLRYLAPMRSVMLQLATSGTKQELSLETTHLTTNTATSGDATQIASRRNSATTDELLMMSIYAEVYGTKARCIVASNAKAKDVYSLGEDAFFISSGVEAGVNSAAATSPVNMYTVAEQVPLMVDVRENIDTVPLGLLIHDYYRTDKITLSFDLSENWSKECYFCDSETGEKTLIVDGMELEVDMPANHATRYYIQGPDKAASNGNNGGDIVSSTDKIEGDINVWAYSQGNGQLTVATNDILKSVVVYDLAGRMIANRTLDLQYSSTSIDIPTGACIVKAILRDNSVHYLSALVK